VALPPPPAVREPAGDEPGGKEIAAKVDLQWGTARTYAAAILAADAISDAMDATRECDEEAQR
jgi:hypothetical protein